MTKISAPIPLCEPIERGSGDTATKITEVQIRKPQAGELRGVKLGNIVACDVDTIIKILPRVTVPNLLETEVSAMDPSDLTDLANVLVDFFYSPAQKAALLETLTT